MMSRVSAAVAQRLAVREMSTATYLVSSISLYALIVFLAMVLKDISSIFDLVSAYGISSMAFIIPGMFYSKAVKKFGLADPNDPQVKTRLTISTAFYFLGALNAFLGVFSAIITITGLGE